LSEADPSVYGPAVFEWPKFRAHLSGVRTPAERVSALLADLGAPAPAPRARDLSAHVPGRERTRRLEFIASDAPEP
jgi:hypothetical protein